jgi:CcmD family protein
MLKRLLILFSLAAVLSAPVSAMQPPATGQDTFVSVYQLPPSDQLPAAPFLVAAYSIVWLIAMFYIWTVWRRINKLEGEFRALERRTGKGAPR